MRSSGCYARGRARPACWVTAAESRGRARLVLDPNVLVAAAISSQGPPALLLQLVAAGTAVLVVSPPLLLELGQVPRRDKFRRWLTLEDAEEYLQGIALLSEQEADPPSDRLAGVCRDPDDDYLVFLAEQVQATLLVSGDKDLLLLHRSGLDVRSPREALEGLAYEPPWGPRLIPADKEAVWDQAVGEGHDQVLQVAAGLRGRPGAAEREAAPSDAGHPAVTADMAARGEVGSGGRGRDGDDEPGGVPDRNVAYVKLTPHPGETVKAVDSMPLPDAKILTLLRCPELVERVHSAGWRVHWISDAYPPVQGLPVRP